MRGIGIIVLVAACAPHFDRAAHSGRDGEPWGARKLHFDRDGRATLRGIVTARGGDSVDWVAFDVPSDHGCPFQQLDVSLRWKAPRGRSRLALAVYDETRRQQYRARRDHARADLLLASIPAGRYFARISTPGPDDAGTYVLHVGHGLGMNCDLPPDPYVTVARPGTYQRPAIPSRMDREIADVDAIQIVRDSSGEAELEPVARAAPGARGTFVDEHGVPIPHGTFVVMEARNDATIVRLDEPGEVFLALGQGVPLWTAAIDVPRHRQTVEASLVSVRPADDGDVLLRFDRGSADGVMTGDVGELAHASGVRVPGARFVIVEVGEHESTGAGPFVLTDPDHLRAVIAPP